MINSKTTGMGHKTQILAAVIYFLSTGLQAQELSFSQTSLQSPKSEFDMHLDRINDRDGKSPNHVLSEGTKEVFSNWLESEVLGGDGSVMQAKAGQQPLKKFSLHGKTAGRGSTLEGNTPVVQTHQMGIHAGFVFVRVYDACNVLVHQQTTGGSLSMNLSRFKPGVYWLQIQNSDSVIYQKLVLISN